MRVGRLVYARCAVKAASVLAKLVGYMIVACACIWAAQTMISGDEDFDRAPPRGIAVSRYQVTIKWADGTITRATVTSATLRGFKLSACRDASVKIVKVSP